MPEPSDSKKKRYNLRNKKSKEKETKKECKKHSDDGDDVSDEEVEEEEIDEVEYKKFLQKLFPSKHLDEKVKAFENLKQKKGETSKEKSEEVIYL